MVTSENIVNQGITNCWQYCYHQNLSPRYIVRLVYRHISRQSKKESECWQNVAETVSSRNLQSYQQTERQQARGWRMENLCQKRWKNAENEKGGGQQLIGQLIGRSSDTKGKKSQVRKTFLHQSGGMVNSPINQVNLLFTGSD